MKGRKRTKSEKRAARKHRGRELEWLIEKVRCWSDPRNPDYQELLRRMDWLTRHIEYSDLKRDIVDIRRLSGSI